MFAVIVKDKNTEDGRLKFRTLGEALNHARMVIVPQIGEALKSVIEADDPSPWKMEAEQMCDLLTEIFHHENDRVIKAIEDWAKLAEHDNFGDMWCEVF